MDALAVDVDDVLVVRRELLLAPAPVVPVAPVLEQTGEVVELGALLPADPVDLAFGSRVRSRRSRRSSMTPGATASGTSVELRRRRQLVAPGSPHAAARAAPRSSPSSGSRTDRPAHPRTRSPRPRRAGGPASRSSPGASAPRSTWSGAVASDGASSGRLRSDQPIRVSTEPGTRHDTPMCSTPCARTSCATHSASAAAPNFDTTYGPEYATVSMPAIDDVITTCAGSPCSISRGTNARTPWIGPQRFTPSTQAQSASVRCHDTPAWNTPALRQTRCAPPNVSKAAAASASTAAASLTSVGTASVSAPSAATSAAASSSTAASMSAITTRMPSRAAVRDSPRPIPLAAPVITATFPAKSSITPPSLGFSAR